jgi:hypothetical protein
VHSIAGTALTTYATERPGLELGPADLAGADSSVPYQPGLNAGTRTLKGRDYPLYLQIVGTGSNRTGDFYARAQALTALILHLDTDFKPAPFTLTRTLVLPSSTQVCTITARYSSGLRWVCPDAPWVGNGVPVLTLLDGWWLDGGGAKVFA